jgi:hypothetical protein
VTHTDTPEQIAERRRAMLRAQGKHQPWTRIGDGCVIVPAEAMHALIRAAKAGRRRDAAAAEITGRTALRGVPYSWQARAR